MGQLESSQNAKRYYSHLERRLAVSYKVKHTLAAVPAIPLLVIYSREIKTHVLVLSLWHTIIWGSQNWRKPKCPPAGERIHKLQYIHLMENYLAREWIKLVKNSNVDESLQHYIEQKKPDKWVYRYDSIYIKFPNRWS